ncbi:MAG TPA: alpha/beta hydrolase [Gemmatimonadaceae bacterium]|nr:alpha/beta hydrolase [Gemmatimonadaceae bacterium]
MTHVLDRHAKRVLDMLAAGRGGNGAELTPRALRESMERLAKAVDLRSVAVASVDDRRIRSLAGGMTLRAYTPLTAPNELLPGVVFFHGGTGVFCSLDTHDGLCRALAASSGCRIVSVDYRLAPEHPFPAAIDDGLFATQWIADHAAELGIDRERLAVAGDSAGGTIAAVVCQLAQRAGGPRVALQVLLCPVTDLASESPSRAELATGFFIERSTLEWAKALYCAGADLYDPRISPLRSTDLVGLPPAQIHTAEFDPMRDEGQAYADALSAAGVDVSYVCHEGLIHHFYCMAGAIPRAREVLVPVGAAIGDALRAAPPRPIVAQ